MQRRSPRVQCSVARVGCSVVHIGCDVDHTGCRVAHVGCSVVHIVCNITQIGCSVAHILYYSVTLGYLGRPYSLKDFIFLFVKTLMFSYPGSNHMHGSFILTDL